MITLDGSTTSSLAAAEKRRENGIPVVMMYGENDWMDIGGGYAAEKKFEEEK
jgi:cardiolipin-specific phospholipase